MDAIRIILKNIAQVLLLNNSWTGLFVLAGIFVGNWKVGLMALSASVIPYCLQNARIIQKRKSTWDWPGSILYLLPLH